MRACVMLNMSAAYNNDDDDDDDLQLHHDSTVLIVMSFVMTYKIYYKSVEVLKSHRMQNADKKKSGHNNNCRRFMKISFIFACYAYQHIIHIN